MKGKSSLILPRGGPVRNDNNWRVVPVRLAADARMTVTVGGASFVVE